MTHPRELHVAKVWLAPIQGAIIDRQDANLELFQTYFNMPEFADLLTQWLTES